MKISDNFYKSEWECQCLCGQCIKDLDLIFLAEKIRAIWNNPMIVHSVNRCRNYNRKIGGVKYSQHIQGKAIDFHISKIPVKELHKKMLELYQNNEIRNLGLYDTFVHVDVRKLKHLWYG